MIPFGVSQAPLHGLLFFFADLKKPWRHVPTSLIFEKATWLAKPRPPLCVLEPLEGDSHSQQMRAPVCGYLGTGSL